MAIKTASEIVMEKGGKPITVVGGLELGRELSRTMTQVNSQIEEIRAEAKRMGIPAEKMRDAHGGYILAPLLAAKAQTLHAIVLVNQKR